MTSLPPRPCMTSLPRGADDVSLPKVQAMVTEAGG
jgi:hypothetical protein